MQNISPGRLVLAVALVLSCVVIGLSAPLVFEFDANEFKLSNVAVFAAARDGHEILAPVDIIPRLRTQLERGTIGLTPFQGNGAKQGQALDSGVPKDGSARLLIDGGVFRIGGKAAQSSEAADAEAAQLVEALRKLNFQSAAIRNSTVEIAMPDGRIETLTSVAAEVQANRRSSVTIRGTGNLRGQEVSFELSAHPVLDGSTAASLPLKLRVKAPLLDVSFDGRVSVSDALDLQGRVEAAMSDLRGVARWFGARWPSGPGLQSATIKGDFDWQGPALAFDQATFRMDGNEATGTLALSFTGENPAFTGTLAMQSLDLTPYLSAGGDGDQLSALLAWARSNEGDLSEYLATQVDADLRVSAGRLSVGQWSFGRFAASLSLKKGRVLADVAEIGIDSGRASGQLTADLSRSLPQVSIRAKLEDIDAANASMALLGHSAVHGLSNIAVDLAAEGQTVSELVKGAHGKVNLSLYEGGRLGIDVKGLVAAAAQNGGVEGWGTAIRGQTTVDDLEAKFRVDKGIMASELVEAKLGDSMLKAVGTISLQSRQVDLRLLMDALPEKAAENKAAREVLVFRGPWAAPSITLER